MARYYHRQITKAYKGVCATRKILKKHEPNFPEFPAADRAKITMIMSATKYDWQKMLDSPEETADWRVCIAFLYQVWTDLSSLLNSGAIPEWGRDGFLPHYRGWIVNFDIFIADCRVDTFEDTTAAEIAMFWGDMQVERFVYAEQKVATATAELKEAKYTVNNLAGLVKDLGETVLEEQARKEEEDQ